MKYYVTLFLSMIFLIGPPALGQNRIVSAAEEESTSSGNYKRDFRFELLYAQAGYTVDVINMFADHLRFDSEASEEYGGRLTYKIWDELYAFGTYTYSEVRFEETSQYDLEKEELIFRDFHYGLGYKWRSFGIRMGYGGRTYHTYLETDTNFYFHNQLDVHYAMLGLDYRFETDFFFDVEMYFDNQFYFPMEDQAFQLDEGYARVWGGRVVFGEVWRIGFGYELAHRNIKMTHDFFDLKNEMNNKSLVNQFSAFTSYSF